MSILKNQKIYYLFCMNVPCVFLKHAHWDLKKDSWVILGLISGNCIYWHQRKWQYFLKYWWHEDLRLAIFFRQAAATKKTYMHSCLHSQFFLKNNFSHWPSALLSSPIHSTFLCGLTKSLSPQLSVLFSPPPPASLPSVTTLWSPMRSW